jgi:BMFP domain-containing protein YqiC
MLNFSQALHSTTHEEHVHGQPQDPRRNRFESLRTPRQQPRQRPEKNARALLASGFSKLDLVTREEFEVQREVLAHTREKLADLEHRVARLEAELAARAPADE